MSKGLEALQFMRERDMFLPSCANTIEKELKALEIIKTKILYVNNIDELKVKLEVELTHKECEILREVLK